MHYEVEIESRDVPMEARVHALASWSRVVGEQGETVAFTPDQTTARRIADLLEQDDERRGR